MIRWLKQLFKIKSPSQEALPSEEQVSLAKSMITTAEPGMKLIEVKDIKSLMVKEFNEKQEMEAVIETLKNEIQELKEVKILHDASLVMLNEYERKVETRDNRLADAELKISYLNKVVDEVSEEKNNYIIQYKLIKDTMKEVEANYDDLRENFTVLVDKALSDDYKRDVNRILYEYRNTITNNVLNHKGVVAKEKLIEYNEAAYQSFKYKEVPDQSEYAL